jgi:predicted transcriptional regulator
MTRRPSSRSRTLLKFLNAASNKSDADSALEAVSSFKRRDLAPEVARLRAVKSEVEAKVMRAAADISGRAHAKVHRSICQVRMNELMQDTMPCSRLCDSPNQACQSHISRRISNIFVHGTGPSV